MKPTREETKRKGFVTQCDRAQYATYGEVYGCDATTRLEKPGRWRCEKHVRLYGPLPKETP